MREMGLENALTRIKRRHGQGNAHGTIVFNEIESSRFKQVGAISWSDPKDRNAAATTTRQGAPHQLDAESAYARGERIRVLPIQFQVIVSILSEQERVVG